MKMPTKCPNCEQELSVWGDGKPVYFFERGEPDFDKDSPDRIVDSIVECSECHTLFRLRWKLESIHRLEEILVGEEKR